VAASLFVESSTGVLFTGDKHSASHDTESRVLNIIEIGQTSKMTSQVSGRLSFHCTPFINCICLSEGLHGQFRISKHGTNAFPAIESTLTSPCGRAFPGRSIGSTVSAGKRAPLDWHVISSKRYTAARAGLHVHT